MMDNQQMGPPAGSPPLGQAHGPFGPTAMGPQFGMGQPNPGMMANPMANAYMGQPPGMLNPANTLSADLKDAMRSFRDSLAFSFQTLNLTLSSLNQTVSTVGTKLGRMTPDTNDLSRNQYAQVGTPGVYLGGMSPNMANYLGNNSFGSIFSHYAPANISPLEFYTERARELGLRSSNMMVTAGAGLGEELVNWGATMWAGKKIMGALGIGTSGLLGEMGAWALGAPIGTAATVAASYLTDPIVEYATRHNRDVAMMRRMSPRIGSGFDLSQSQRAVRGLESLALQDTLRSNSLQPRMGLEGFKEMTMMGLQGNMFNGSSADDLIKQVSSASFVVKFLMGVMGNKDVRETMTLVKQLKDMGINVFQAKDMALTLGGDAFKYGRAMGVDAGSLFNTAANMSMAAYGQFGNPAFVGIRSGMQNLAYMQELEKRGLMSAADIAAGGGAQNIGARMMSLEAGMMNSYSLGLPMLYAGWDGGKGFNKENFQKAFASGGYFGVVQGAINNMYKGNIADLAHVIMNKNNIMADAEGIDGGKFMETTRLGMLEAQLKMFPDIDDVNIPLERRESLAAYYIMQLAPSLFQTEIDPATAKAYAKKIMRPSIMRRVDAVAMNKARQGMFEYISASRGIGRFGESITESIEKFGARAHDTFIGAPARKIADWATNKFEALHGNPFLDNTITGNTNFSAYMWARDNYDEATERQYSQWDYSDVMERMHDPDSMWHMFKRTLFSNNNRLEDKLAYNLAIRHANLYKRMRSKDRLTESDYFDRYSSLLGRSHSLSDLRSAMNAWDTTVGQLGDDVSDMIGGLASLDMDRAASLKFYRNAKRNSRMSFMGLGDLSDSKSPNAPLLYAAAGLMNLHEDDQGILGRFSREEEELLKRAGIPDLLDPTLVGDKARPLIASIFNEDIAKNKFDYNTMTLSQEAQDLLIHYGSNALNPTKYNTPNFSNVDKSRLAAIVLRAFDKNKGEDQDYLNATARYGLKVLEDTAEAFAPLNNDFMYNIPTGLKEISLLESNAQAALSKLNVTPEELLNVMSKATNNEQRDALFSALGEAAVLSKEQAGSLDGVNKVRLTEKFKDNKVLMDYFNKITNSKSGDDILGILKQAYTGGAGDELKDMLSSDSRAAQIKASTRMFRGIHASGAKLTADQGYEHILSTLGINGTIGEKASDTFQRLPDIVSGWQSQSNLSQEQRAMLHEYQRMSKMDAVELSKTLGLTVSELSDKIKVEGAKANRLVEVGIGSVHEQSEAAETNKLAGLTKKSAIDAAVVSEGSIHYVNVRSVDDNMLTKARQVLTSEYTAKFNTKFAEIQTIRDIE